MSGEENNTLGGQWIGQSRGDPPATIVLDLDSVGPNALGYASLFPHDEKIPASVARVNVSDNITQFSINELVAHFDSANGQNSSSPEFLERFRGIELPKRVRASFSLVAPDILSASWNTEIGSGGEAELRRWKFSAKSNLVCESGVSDWAAFQSYVTDSERDGFIYRGQTSPWPLQTSFHRTRRKDMVRYLGEDIPRLHRALTGRTNHIFDLMKPPETGAFLNLAQHHGFPTPLLDWSYSPFVAAYFAYSNVATSDGDGPVRIYAFDKNSYVIKYRQFQTLTHTKPHFSILEALSIENDRAVPQQGLLTLTNLHDVEGFIEFLEREGTSRFLYAFDLPRNEAAKAMSDLRLMGITRSTLFPGIESICRDFADRYFV